jgi:hypothetical protein
MRRRTKVCAVCERYACEIRRRRRRQGSTGVRETCGGNEQQPPAPRGCHHQRGTAAAATARRRRRARRKHTHVYIYICIPRTVLGLAHTYTLRSYHIYMCTACVRDRVYTYMYVCVHVCASEKNWKMSYVQRRTAAGGHVIALPPPPRPPPTTEPYDDNDDDYDDGGGPDTPENPIRTTHVHYYNIVLRCGRRGGYSLRTISYTVRNVAVHTYTCV